MADGAERGAVRGRTGAARDGGAQPELRLRPWAGLLAGVVAALAALAALWPANHKGTSGRHRKSSAVQWRLAAAAAAIAIAAGAAGVGLDLSADQPAAASPPAADQSSAAGVKSPHAAATTRPASGRKPASPHASRRHDDSGRPPAIRGENPSTQSPPRPGHPHLGARSRRHHLAGQPDLRSPMISTAQAAREPRAGDGRCARMSVTPPARLRPEAARRATAPATLTASVVSRAQRVPEPARQPRQKRWQPVADLAAA
jgi:hypothetical protein